VKVFVDTNVFLRFLTEDDAGQSTKAAALFRAAEAGHVALTTGPPVLFEVAWTLRRAYKLPKDKVLDVLDSVLAVQGLTLSDHALVEAAIARARVANQEFADAYIAASADGSLEIATFNERDFLRLGAKLHAW
jgi:predicted nucleic acid-binding protein